MAKHRVNLLDTTLRDGEQTAGVVFSPEEKINIALRLDEARVRYIEAGTPAMDEPEREVLKALVSLPLRSTLVAWNRANEDDIHAALQCGFTFLHISVPVSDLHIIGKLGISRESVLTRLDTALSLAKSYGVRFSVGAEDASRADSEFFLRVADLAAAKGAKFIRYADTVGCLPPRRVFTVLEKLVQRCPLPLEFHGHNDFGLAVANSLAAAQAGCSLLSSTVLGLGERAGNANLVQLVKTLEHFEFHTGIRARKLSALEACVAKAVTRQSFALHQEYNLLKDDENRTRQGTMPA